jgi:hypothetical protein
VTGAAHLDRVALRATERRSVDIVNGQDLTQLADQRGGTGYLCTPSAGEQLDLAAVATLDHTGAVYAVPAPRMPDTNPVAGHCGTDRDSI